MKTINHNGKTLTLDTQAYLVDGYYQAIAEDSDGNKYRVHWTIISDSENADEACDWKAYTVEEL
jgi:hypothetical protein